MFHETQWLKTLECNNSSAFQIIPKGLIMQNVSKCQSIGDPFMEKNEKSLNAETPEKGDPLGFFIIYSVAKHRKSEGGPFEENFLEKCLTMPKNCKWDPLVSPGMVCYAEKEENRFWFSSLGQMIQFGTINFCRTFKNYSGQFVWIEKKRVTIIVAFHFMKRRLKTKTLTIVRKEI